MALPALVATLLASSCPAYALNNSDLIQLSSQISRQQQEQTTGAVLAQAQELDEQIRLRHEAYLDEQRGMRQQEQLREKQRLQEQLREWQRHQEAREFENQGLRNKLLEQQQSGLFQ